MGALDRSGRILHHLREHLVSHPIPEARYLLTPENIHLYNVEAGDILERVDGNGLRTVRYRVLRIDLVGGNPEYLCRSIVTAPDEPWDTWFTDTRIEREEVWWLPQG